MSGNGKPTRFDEVVKDPGRSCPDCGNRSTAGMVQVRLQVQGSVIASKGLMLCEPCGAALFDDLRRQILEKKAVA